ncbi:2-oxoglutarate dehydrogenase E1 component [Coemansia sp. RSA 2050]|nr:2-oxoglutarate dehydrogenase E1 component [Coemansia sp. RSA 2050]
MVHKTRGHSKGRKSKPPGRHLIRNHTSTDDFSQLNRALKKSSLYCKDMAGDGNCLFRALADQTDGTPDTHLRHREAVCDYMERHPDEFSPFLDESFSFDQYTNNMRRSGVFGGNLELVAFARNYRLDIKVYQLGGTVFVISGATDPSLSRSMPTVHIAYHSYEHYSSVRNLAGPHDGLPLPIVDNTNADDDDDVDNNGKLPTDIEKIIMGSTAVENHPLVRYLLQKHQQNSDRVIELLIQWMADDPFSTAEPWWAKDGPPVYDGPVATSELAQTIDKAANPPEAIDDDESTPNQPTEPPVPAPKPPQHKKGAARQKKAED